jgi:S-adenosylmethionine:tRNA ribosyltransferase-isomerase
MAKCILLFSPGERCSTQHPGYDTLQPHHLAVKEVKTSDFDYRLPSHLIAQKPIEPRDASRLMVLRREDGGITHTRFGEIGEYLRAGDLLVCNDSRVMLARLLARKVPTGGRVELLLTVKREDNLWEALIRGRRVKVGGEVKLVGRDGEASTPVLHAQILEGTPAGGRLVRFDHDVEPLLEQLGLVPLPPYIHESLEDAERYQTVYARRSGSVAAPTAGLHFSPQLMAGLEIRGIELAFLTLHIGLDTFRPVREQRVEDHQMHTEYCQVTTATALAVNRARAEDRRVIATGTTVVRALETAARGLSVRDGEVIESFEGWTDLFIYPGYRFRVVDALITNFHLPRSTLLMLVAAFTGKEFVDKAYRAAIRREYRFYSFGDAMLIL